jgi:hypothetical protein
MTFTLTHDFLAPISAAAAKGDLGPFIVSIDPNVEWRIGASDDKGTGKQGVYVSSAILAV